MLTRISIPITTQEREGLRLLAENELRDPREHVRYLVRQELTKHGIVFGAENSKSASVKVCETTTGAFAQ